jgi:hypothetical protein
MRKCEEYTDTGKLRCAVINENGEQCNYPIHHGEHAFGICGMLADLSWYEEKCSDDNHIGTCSVCLVRSVRDDYEDD